MKKFSLRKKISITGIFLSLIIAFGLGFWIYQIATNNNYENFKQSQLSLARTIAAGISGEKHKHFNALKSIYSQDYHQANQFIKTIKNNEEFITYLYTVNYDEKKDKFFFAVNSYTAETDVCFVGSDLFTFEIWLDDDGKIAVYINQNTYKDVFEVEIEGEKIEGKIKDENGTTIVYLQNKEWVKVVSKDPLVVEVLKKKLDIKNRELNLLFDVSGKLIPTQFNFLAKDQPYSIPGMKFVESKAVVEYLKSLIKSGKEGVYEFDNNSLYGSFLLGAYALIKDDEEKTVGLVALESYMTELKQFKNIMTNTALIGGFISFILSFLVSLLLSETLIRPIKKILKGLILVRNGDLSARIDLNQKDEMGEIALNFNEMTKSLKNYTENLENLVEERTHKLEEQKCQLESEMELARIIQRKMIPNIHPNVEGMKLYSIYQPMRMVGGDFYDYIDFLQFKNKNTGIFISDVSGHGVPAALITSMLKTLMQTSDHCINSPAKFLKYINEKLIGLTGGNFLTAFFGLTDVNIPEQRQNGYMIFIGWKMNLDTIFFFF